ncbi:MAG: hypothetical protein AB7N91_17140 [Candidatus Tectimicrobiota bacterium]
MAEELRMRTIAVRTDPFEHATPRTVAEWSDVLTFVHHLEDLARAGKKFQLVETKGKLSCTLT